MTKPHPAFSAEAIDEIRGRIRTTVLLTKLQDHALGETDMQDSQIKACAILLRKTLPDLQAVDHTSAGGGPLIVEIKSFANPDED